MDIRSTIPLGKSPKDTEMISRILNRSGMACGLISCPIRALCPYVWLVFNFWLKSCVCLRDQPRVKEQRKPLLPKHELCLSQGTKGAATSWRVRGGENVFLARIM